MKKKVKKNGKFGNKFFAALAMGILVVSGLAIGVSTIDNSNTSSSSYGVFKDIRNNPFDFIKAEKLLVPGDFDYIEQMNLEFVGDFNSEKISYSPGDSLKQAEKELDKTKQKS